jgi:hypothetical protein
MQAPAGESLYGAVVNYIGQPISDIDTPGEQYRHSTVQYDTGRNGL